MISRYDIALLPSDEITNEIIELSVSLEKYNPDFVLSDSGPFAHLSLYMIWLSSTDVLAATDIIKNIASDVSSVYAEAIDYYSSRGYIDIEYRRVRQIEILQDDVVDKVNPVRAATPDSHEKKNLSDVAMQNIKECGYESVRDLFRPHVTLAHFPGEASIDRSALPDVNKFSTHFTHLGLFKLGDYGICTEPVEVFELRKSK